MRKTVWALILLSAFLGLLGSGCGDSSSSSSVSKGSLTLSVTDAPVDDAAELWITFTDVTLQGVEGSADQGPFEISAEHQSINLMEFTGGSSAVLVSSLVVPSGNYKLRLDADLTFTEQAQRSWIAFAAESERCAEPLPEGAVWEAGNERCRYPLVIPSEEEAGFRPKGEVVVAAGGNSDFTVEFDLRKNVVNPNNPNDIAFKLKPTGLRLVDDTEVGSLSGGVVLPESCTAESAHVYLYDLAGEEGDFVPDDIHDGNESYVTSVVVEADGSGDDDIYRY